MQTLFKTSAFFRIDNTIISLDLFGATSKTFHFFDHASGRHYYLPQNTFRFIQEHPEVNLHAYPWGEDAETRQTFILR